MITIEWIKESFKGDLYSVKDMQIDEDRGISFAINESKHFFGVIRLHVKYGVLDFEKGRQKNG